MLFSNSTSSITNNPLISETTPNVGQFGWTQADIGHYNQLLIYVDQCRQYAEFCAEKAEYISYTVENVVLPALAEMNQIQDQVTGISEDVNNIYNSILVINGDITVKYADFIPKYNDFITKYSDFLPKYEEMLIVHGEVLTYRNEAQAFAESSEESAINSQHYYDLTYSLYLELLDGRVYRGTWNPHTLAYPDPLGTNSLWDVVLNEGEATFDFDGKTWKWGEKLLYLTSDGLYQQIQSGSSVYSVNGEIGFVTITLDDLGGFAKTGGTITGKTTFTNSSTGINIEGGTGTSGTSGDLRFNTSLLEFEGYASGEWKPVGGGGSVTWSSVNTNTAAQVGKGYLVNASGLTITLPASPAPGKTVGIGDYNSQNFSVTIARNGKPIMGKLEDLVFNTKNSNVVLAYIDNTVGWILTQGFGESQAPYAVFNKIRKTDVAGQTEFAFASPATNAVDVYYNGRKLDPVTDYIVTISSVTLTTPVLASDDVIEIYGWNQSLILNAEGIVYDNTESGLTAGTMQDSIDELAATSYILNSRSNGYLYHQIRAYSGEDSRINCIGRSNTFDGSDGYFVRSLTSTSPDDDGTVLIDSLGRRWLRIIDGEIRPEWWGAVGDGVFDDGVAINKAISFSESKCFSVYFQRDSYFTSIPLIIKTGSGLTLRGNNKGRTTITKTALTAPNVTRTYNGSPFTYDVPCIFALIADNESYVRHIRMSNINLTGLNDDITQTHIFAPRATYSVWENILSSSGRSFFEARLGGFVNTFINCRTALMGIHWDVEGGNAYSLYNTYANGTVSGSPSEGYRFKDTNVNFHGSDTDGLNIGYLALGFTKMSLFGCNTEARLRQVNARDTSSIDVHGGRYGLTMIGSQVASTAACFWAEGSGKIDVYSTKSYKFDFTGGVPTNKQLAIASGSSRITLNDVDLNVTNVNSGVAFTESDLTCTSDGRIEFLISGKTINFVTNHRTSSDFGITGSKQIRKSLDFSTGLTQTLLTVSGADYNEVMITDTSLMYRSTGNNGNGSVSGSTQIKVTGSNRNTATVNLQQSGSQLCPDGLSNTITFASSISGGVITITATASVATVGVCYFLIDAKGAVVRANGELDSILIT